MNLKQFKYGQDNFGYLIYGQEKAVAVDPGAVEAMLGFLNSHKLTLMYVVNTHLHSDHTLGNASILKASNAIYLDRKTLLNQQSIIDIGEFKMLVIPTPGHSEDSISFYAGRFLITGDTLFNGTIGNCFSGDLKAFYKSLNTLAAFNDETLVYAGHDYVQESMQVARRFEPGNAYIDKYLGKYNPEHVCSSLFDERNTNPYLRYNTPDIIKMLERNGLSVKTEFDRFRSLMTIE